VVDESATGSANLWSGSARAAASRLPSPQAEMALSAKSERFRSLRSHRVGEPLPQRPLELSAKSELFGRRDPLITPNVSRKFSSAPTTERD
jgi:hypothetical protein